MFVFLVFAVFTSPTQTMYAAGFDFLGPIVDCGNDVTSYVDDAGQACTKGLCTTCDLLKSAKKVIDFIIVVGMVLAVVLFVNAGFLYVTGGSSPASVSKAHRVFLSTLLGLIITLSAWLLIDLIMKSIYGGEGWAPWNEILCPRDLRSEVCVAKRDTLPVDPEAKFKLTPISASGSGSGHANIDTTSTRVDFYNVKSSACAGECVLAKYFDEDLSDFTSALSAKGIRPDSWQITEINSLPSCPRHAGGSCNTSGGGCHCNTCHAEGTCVDIGFKNKAHNTNAQQVLRVLDAAQQAGVRAVFEVTSPEAAEAMRRDIEARRTTEQVDLSKQIVYVPHATEAHFSIYGTEQKAQ